MTTTETIEKLKIRGETGKAKRAFLDYVGLGPNRTLKMLLEQYRNPELYTQDNYRDKNAPPTRQLATLKNWSSAYNWVERSGTVTDKQAEIILHEQEIALAEAMKHTYASVAKRIEALNDIAEQLVEHIQDQGVTRVVLKVAKGRIAEEVQVDVLAINALRGILEDLARETGGRAKNIRHRLPDGPISKNQTIFVLPPVEEQAEVINVTPGEAKN